MASTTLSQKTFTKFFQLRESPLVTTISIFCQDSAGATINCNYFSISISPLASTAVTSPCPVIFVSPSGISGRMDVVNPLIYNNNTLVTGLSSLTAGQPSPLGVSLLLTSGVTQYEYLCLPNESFSKISLLPIPTNPVGIVGNNAFNICVTYGIVLPFNDLRAADKNLYTKGR